MAKFRLHDTTLFYVSGKPTTKTAIGLSVFAVSIGYSMSIGCQLNRRSRCYQFVNIRPIPHERRKLQVFYRLHRRSKTILSTAIPIALIRSRYDACAILSGSMQASRQARMNSSNLSASSAFLCAEFSAIAGVIPTPCRHDCTVCRGIPRSREVLSRFPPFAVRTASAVPFSFSLYRL